MRYEHRTARAIDALGGRAALIEAMSASPNWDNPTRTVETWLERRQIGRDGILFLWRLAEERKQDIGPDDMTVIDIAP